MVSHENEMFILQFALSLFTKRALKSNLVFRSLQKEQQERFALYQKSPQEQIAPALYQIREKRANHSFLLFALLIKKNELFALFKKERIALTCLLYH